MKTISLSKGYVALVDDEDYERVSQFKWYAKKPSKYGKIYAFRGYRIGPRRDKKMGSVYMHRFIMNAQKGEEVDHIDTFQSLDNRKANLRLSTRTENARNQHIRSDNKSGFKGVSWDKRHNSWQSKIMHHQKTIWLGYYSDPIIAAKTYDAAARKYHGEFARTNF